MRAETTVTEQEIATQPDIWRQAAAMAGNLSGALPAEGRRLALIGCGTSYFIGQAIACLRESRGLGESDAFAASEFPFARGYESVAAISRSGTTTEVIRALESVRPAVQRIALSATAGSPVLASVQDALLFEFADEESLVQTRFATAMVAFARAWLGEDVEPLARAAEQANALPLPIDPTRYSHFVFLGVGWTVGLAHEAALKVRESAGVWTESYPALEYRHGPVSAATDATLVWALGDVDPVVLEVAAATGATVQHSMADPLVELVAIQRLGVELALLRGRDPDSPLHLTRSIV
jgi:glucosamine--fructose-6-phosphate aminotransferase (isomerizing)